ncbi:MAG: hypothetical protein WD335_02280 [Candidatus Paceibacterota bacterium]
MRKLSFVLVTIAIAVTSTILLLPETITDIGNGTERVVRYFAIILNIFAGALIASKLFLSWEEDVEKEAVA